MTITVFVDSTETRAYFSRLEGRLRDMRTPNRQASRALERLVLAGFDRQQTPWGTRWRSLKKSTKRLRRLAGYAEGPALRASGYLRASIRSAYGRTGFSVEASAAYADFHQNGGIGFHGSVVPARPYMPIRRGAVSLPQPWWDAVLEPFNELARKP